MNKDIFKYFINPVVMTNLNNLLVLHLFCCTYSLKRVVLRCFLKAPLVRKSEWTGTGRQCHARCPLSLRWYISFRRAVSCFAAAASLVRACKTWVAKTTTWGSHRPQPPHTFNHLIAEIFNSPKFAPRQFRIGSSFAFHQSRWSSWCCRLASSPGETFSP